MTWMLILSYKNRVTRDLIPKKKKKFTAFLLSVRDLQFYWSMSTHSFFELRMKKAVDAVRFHKCRLPDSPQQAGPLKAKWRKTPFVSIQNEAL